MRPLEIFILVILTLTIYLLFKDDKKGFLYCLFLGLIVCLVHFVLEKYRWQMIPGYSLFFILFIFYKIKTSISYIKKTVLLFLLAISISLPCAIPVFKLPAPSGKYPVGSQIFQWTDSSRVEWFTNENLNDHRKIIAQVWYPSHKQEGKEPLPYIDNIELRSKTLGAAGGFPGWISEHISLIKTHSFLNASPNTQNGPFPLLIFSHGITGMRQIHTSVIEELTSNGYVVVGIDHPYDCNLTIFEDGSMADYRSDITGHPDSVQIRNKQLKTRVGDISFVLDKLTLLNNSFYFNNIIDLSLTGVLGHSYGGASAINVSFVDPRIKACLALDSWMNPLSNKIINTGINQPFLHLGRASWNDSDYPSSPDLLMSFVKLKPKNKYSYILNGSRHLDFCDIPLFSPFSGLILETGSVSAKTAVSTTNKIVLTFFDHFLKKLDNGFPNCFANSPLLTKKLNSKMYKSSVFRFYRA